MQNSEDIGPCRSRRGVTVRHFDCGRAPGRGDKAPKTVSDHSCAASWILPASRSGEAWLMDRPGYRSSWRDAKLRGHRSLKGTARVTLRYLDYAGALGRGDKLVQDCLGPPLHSSIGLAGFQIAGACFGIPPVINRPRAMQSSRGHRSLGGMARVILRYLDYARAARQADCRGSS